MTATTPRRHERTEPADSLATVQEQAIQQQC